ncbi:MAG: alpha/beta hydrolase [Marmoricola sp.]
MRDEDGGGGSTGSVVRLETTQLRAALAQLTTLADAVDSQRQQVTQETPIAVPSLAEGGPAALTAAWLRDQQPGLRDLLDLAVLLETHGGTATYVGTGTFTDARTRIPTEIVNALDGLDPDDPASRGALASMEDLLGRYAEDPEIGHEIVEELGGTGLVHVFDSLAVDPPSGDASPDEVNAWWSALTPTQQLAVTLLRGDKVGNRDGVPAWGRDLANRAQIPLVRKDLEDQLADLTEGQHGYEPYGRGYYLEPAEAQEVRDRLAALDSVDSTLDLGGRQLLLLDAYSGDQVHAAVAVGDVDTADHVSVFTPGFTTTVQGSLKGIDSDMATLRSRAQQELIRNGSLDTVATVSWLGYDAPQWDGVVFPSQSVASDDLARSGGDDLAGFYSGINASREQDPHLTALGHSYGSTTTGFALQHEGTGVDDAIVFGSPGLGTSDRDDLHVPDGHLYRIEARRDPVADLAQFGIDPTWLDGVDGLSAKDAEIDGIEYQESTGHSEYLDDGTTSQHNIAATVAGTGGQVHDDGHGAGDVLTWWPEWMR